ncbi:MAG: M48 family metallopeptidase [Roseateles asaccharophilus]|uniref:Peptidase M48-like protein n=1 Tax=Roseateles asaccharophilus TaxID=582607 RepID=A0A4R6NFY9_9BURK|nr:M48 family metallopeptidase [Roseateles asaccharophilus]MDN3543118.1 M48 family metallopeptidase [Roseateles asaccharophilus]TDP13184.1 peptidase M48-like protein [Roseateles asaccharophilus]
MQHDDVFHCPDTLDLSAAPDYGFGRCDCHRPAARLSRRRLFSGLVGAGALAATPAWAREGVEVGNQSSIARLVPAEQVEQAGAQQYQQMLAQARQQGALAPDSNPQLRRLRAIAQRIVPHSYGWNPRARQWRWEVNLLGSPELNAFCMPGGKIAFYYGILEKLKLNDDEVATIMGHEVAHALREHARERMAKTTATRIGAGLVSSLLGLGNVGDAVLNMGGQLLTLKFSREDESEADLVGMELAARAGYDPAAGVSLWEKMGEASKGAPPQWLSTHPAGPSRIRDIQANLPKVEGLYARAEKPAQRFEVAPPLPKRAG